MTQLGMKLKKKQTHRHAHTRAFAELPQNGKIRLHYLEFDKNLNN